MRFVVVCAEKQRGASAFADTLQQHWTEHGIDAGTFQYNDKGTILSSFPPASDIRELEELPCLIGSKGDEALIELDDDVVGRGSMGVVYAGRQRSLRRDVAIKALAPAAWEVDKARQLLCEARVTGALEHPNVVPVHLLGTDGGREPLIVMKRITGTPWSQLLFDEDQLREELNVADPLEWHLGVLMQVCNAVHYAHSKGVIHRDLKPENVMIGGFGEVYVVDWGLAVTVADHGELGLPLAVEITDISGTPAYMAPEMVVPGSRAVDERTDVYLLGAILHQILTGETRHDGDTVIETLTNALRSSPIDYPSEVPSDLAALCNRATNAVAEERHPTARALRLAVADHLSHRHSSRLSAEASLQLDRLRVVLSTAAVDDEEQAIEIYRRFGACRFAFQQAQREWADNTEARDGLQALLELVIDYELRGNDAKAASILIAELPEPRPALTLRLEELKHQIEAEQEEILSLRMLEHNANKGVGSRERVLVLAAMGAIWTLFYFSLGWMMRAGILAAQHATFLGVNLAYGVFLLVAMRVWRQKLTETDLNRRFLWALWGAFLAGALFWPMAWRVAMPFGWAVAVTLLLYATVVWMAAAAIDRALAWAAIPYVAGAAGAAWLPLWAFEALALSTLGAMGGAAMVWARLPVADPTAQAPR